MISKDYFDSFYKKEKIKMFLDVEKEKICFPNKEKPIFSFEKTSPLAILATTVLRINFLDKPELLNFQDPYLVLKYNGMPLQIFCADYVQDNKEYEQKKEKHLIKIKEMFQTDENTSTCFLGINPEIFISRKNPYATYLRKNSNVKNISDNNLLEESGLFLYDEKINNNKKTAKELGLIQFSQTFIECVNTSQQINGVNDMIDLFKDDAFITPQLFSVKFSSASQIPTLSTDPRSNIANVRDMDVLYIKDELFDKMKNSLANQIVKYIKGNLKENKKEILSSLNFSTANKMVIFDTENASIIKNKDSNKNQICISSRSCSIVDGQHSTATISLLYELFSKKDNKYSSLNSQYGWTLDDQIKKITGMSPQNTNIKELHQKKLTEEIIKKIKEDAELNQYSKEINENYITEKIQTYMEEAFFPICIQPTNGYENLLEQIKILNDKRQVSREDEWVSECKEELSILFNMYNDYIDNVFKGSLDLKIKTIKAGDTHQGVATERDDSIEVKEIFPYLDIVCNDYAITPIMGSREGVKSKEAQNKYWPLLSDINILSLNNVANKDEVNKLSLFRGLIKKPTRFKNNTESALKLIEILLSGNVDGRKNIQNHKDSGGDKVLMFEKMSKYTKHIYNYALAERENGKTVKEIKQYLNNGVNKSDLHFFETVQTIMGVSRLYREAKDYFMDEADKGNKFKDGNGVKFLSNEKLFTNLVFVAFKYRYGTDFSIESINKNSKKLLNDISDIIETYVSDSRNNPINLDSMKSNGKIKNYQLDEKSSQALNLFIGQIINDEESINLLIKQKTIKI